MPPVVLVHGAWSGAWSWRPVARLLQARGHEVFAPTLTGLAERAHVPPERVSLSTHVADVAGLLRFERLERALLVAHSYGGMVATGAADREPGRVAGLFYLDAFVPDDGESVWSLVGPARAAEQRAAAQAFDGGKSVPRALSPTSSAPDNAARFGALFTPQPVCCLEEPFRAENAAAAARIPRAYVLCATYRDSPFHAIAARMRARGVEVREIDALHDVVRTDPPLVADLIEAAAETLDKAPARRL